MGDIRDFYNKTAISWSWEWLKDKRQSNVCQTFYSMFSNAGTLSPKILDVGCGLGYDSYLLSELGASVIGVDFSEKSIEIARQNVQNCDFFVSDITMPLDNLGQFDGMLCLGVIDYVDIMKLGETFENFCGIMKKGALLLVSVLDGIGKNEQKSNFNIDGESYDLNFYCYDIEQICAVSFPKLKLVDSLYFDDYRDGWRYYVFMKV